MSDKTTLTLTVDASEFEKEAIEKFISSKPIEFTWEHFPESQLAKAARLAGYYDPEELKRLAKLEEINQQKTAIDRAAAKITRLAKFYKVRKRNRNL